MERKIHVFDNGVRVYDDHLIPVQRERYRRRNVHEAEEEDVFVALVRALPPGGCFLDVGCAIGYYPLLAKRLAPGLVVHAVEPLARHRAWFVENIGLNGLRADDFTIHAEGVAASAGEAQLVDDGYGSAILPGAAAADGGRAHAITTTTLDALVERIGRRVDLCQMDVQGLERAVLDGARKSLRTGAVTTFLIGTHSRPLHRACLDLLARSGYAIAHDAYETKEQPDGILAATRGERASSGRAVG
jgi:FkbM family methyltransferase